MSSRDSAGTPFAGRSLPATGYSGDAGAGDPRLVAALRDYTTDPALEPAVLAALSAARVLVAVVASSDEVALALLVGADGRHALPVFTAVETVRRWRADARPVPVDGRRAALAAAAEGADVLVVDSAGPVSYVLEGRHTLEALARGELATPAYDDQQVGAHVAAAAATLPDVRSVHLAPAAGADAEVHVVLDTPADLTRFTEQLRAVPRWLVRGLTVRATLGVTPSARCIYRRDPR